jgi:hypothetical protein
LPIAQIKNTYSRSLPAAEAVSKLRFLNKQNTPLKIQRGGGDFDGNGL